MDKRPIIALDFASKEEIDGFLENFSTEESLFLKIGMELFYQEGLDIVRFLKSKGHSIFLDLKLHDIPNTVERAMARIATLEVDITNVHAAGGINMMKAAKEGLEKGTSLTKKVPKLIAVTQLTSTNEQEMQQEQMIQSSLEESVLHYAKCTEKAGLDGVVCSAQESKKIHQVTNQSFICLTPGIRPTGMDNGDQHRVVTPKEARKNEATYIVVGRPITQAKNPSMIYKAIKKEWSGE